MNVAELMIESLERAGVTTAYGVPGEENTVMMLALQNSSIEVILTRHEQAAAFMASVYGRITGKPAVCFATLGPGATNLITGVADATLDHVPMVVLTGQGARARIGKIESHQIIDLQKLFEPVTKLSQTLMQAEAVSSTVAEALRIACTPHPGAVHLSLPEDLAAEETDTTPSTFWNTAEAIVLPQALSQAVKLLQKAERPLIVAGHGVLRGGAAATLKQFVNEAGIPLATTFMAKGILPADHPLHLHTIGQPFEDHVDDILPSRDLIIAIGFDPVELPPAAISDGGRIPVLHIADTPARLQHDWQIACDLVGDISRSLRGITSGLQCKTWWPCEAVMNLRKKLTDQRKKIHEDQDGLHPADVCRAIEHTLVSDTLVISGVGMHKMQVARYLAAKAPGQIIIPNGLAGMGLALPGAIAAAHLGRHSRVIAICGDGEFLMNVQDMETATRLGLSLTVVLWEDGGYGLIKSKQEDDAGTHTDLSFGNPDWEQLANSFGWAHHRVTQVAELSEVLDDHRTGLNLITLPINYRDALQRDEVVQS